MSEPAERSKPQGGSLLPKWSERPIEIANLLNPAYVGVVLRNIVNGYNKETESRGMPFELAFIAPTLCIHPATRRRFPAKTAVTSIHSWLTDPANRDIIISFGDRVASMVPFVREAIIFACHHRIIWITDTARFLTGPGTPRGITTYPAESIEVGETLHAATKTGRWLALAGDTTTIFASLGIRP